MAEIARYDDRVDLNLWVTGGIPGNVYNLWVVIFNDTSLCEDPATATEPDALCGEGDWAAAEEGRVGEAAFAYLAPAPSGGAVADWDGGFTTTTRTVMEGSTDGVSWSTGTGVNEGVSLQDSLLSEIHLIVRDKGPAIEGDQDALDAQLTDFDCAVVGEETIPCGNAAYRIFPAIPW